MFVDTHLPLLELEGRRSIFTVIYDKDLHIMACGKIVIIKPKDLKAHFSSEGVRGFITFTQQSPFDPTAVLVNLTNLEGRGETYHVHEFPKPYRIDKDQNMCSNQAVGGHFNPFLVEKKDSPEPGYGTTDLYEVGDLSGKFGFLEDVNDDHYFIDFNLPMFGTHSIVGRSVVIHDPNGDRWICANIEYPESVKTAVATFHYPVVGQVIMRQEKGNPFADTTVFVELSYSDATNKNTFEHNWAVHMKKPTKDFYDWQNRCTSVQDEFNPYKVGKGQSYTQCRIDNPLRCALGDLSSKSRKIDIASRKGVIQNKVLYTDVNLALSGPYSVVGRSLVIRDDQAPKHRGNRLACTPIYEEHPITARVRTWFTNVGDESMVSGVVTLAQQTRQDVTKVTINVHGLSNLASGYHVHKWTVPANLDFPCTNDAVSGHFNPFGIDNSIGPFPAEGSVDQYELGDLSGKYGPLDGLLSFKLATMDSELPLSGPNSVLGRSIVIHKKEKNARWICGNIEPNLQVDRPKKIVAIASFHQPEGYLRGYVRLVSIYSIIPL